MNFHFNLATLVNSALFNYLATHTHTELYIANDYNIHKQTNGMHIWKTHQVHGKCKKDTCL